MTVERVMVDVLNTKKEDDSKILGQREFRLSNRAFETLMKQLSVFLTNRTVN